jgi:hypothetical protein
MNDAEAQAFTQPRFRPGSRPWRWDPRERNFSHTRLFGAADPLRLPIDGLHRPRRQVEHQGATVRCGAYSAAVGNGYIRRSRFHPDWQAVSIGKKQGRSVDVNGSEPRACMNSLRDDGSIPWDAATPHLATYGIQATNDSADYPTTAYEQAQNHRITAYLGVDDPFDTFDDIRHALHRAYHPPTGTGAVVHAFGRWFDEWTNPNLGIIPETYARFAGWHAYLFIDWCLIDGMQYLVAQNSYGDGIGDRGFVYFPREVVNREFAVWGAALKIPTGALTKEQIELAKQETIAGRIQRAILEIYYLISEKFGVYA